MATQAEIEVSYDVGNDFFRLWLDERMTYSCAVWRPGDTLESAQLNKHAVLAGFARIDARARVLDIGCGWGANLQYLSESGVRHAHGITLSPSQLAEVERRRLPRVTAELADYRDYEPEEPFDAVVSICMIDHIATPEQSLRGEHIEVFSDYFRRTRAWTRPGAWFGLQTIVLGRIPRRRDHLREMALATERILPGSRCGRLEEIVRCAGRHWEVMRVVTRREHYVRTCAEWLARLRAQAPVIRERWGDELYDDYDHYLRSCVWAFEEGYLSLAQLALRRIDD